MNLKNPLVMCGAVIVVIAVGIVAWRWRSSNNENFPDGTWWLCSNDQCKHGFNLSMKQLSDHHAAHYGEPVPCPKCKSEARRAVKCAKCGTLTPQTNKPIEKCPQCGAELLSAIDPCAPHDLTPFVVSLNTFPWNTPRLSPTELPSTTSS